MLANERHNIIYKMIQKDGAVTTAKLMELFDISIETVRRDLLAMEKANLLKRVHGGAVAEGEIKKLPPLDVRKTENVKLKQEVVKNALQFINEGDTIALTGGSTAMLFVEELKKHFSKLTVAVFSLDLFDLLRDGNNFELILCGGHYNRSYGNFFHGIFVHDILEKIGINKAFIFPASISLTSGIRGSSSDYALCVRKMIESATETYVLSDSTKFEKKIGIRYSDMKKDFTYITDSALPKELQKLYKENGMKIIL